MNLLFRELAIEAGLCSVLFDLLCFPEEKQSSVNTVHLYFLKRILSFLKCARYQINPLDVFLKNNICHRLSQKNHDGNLIAVRLLEDDLNPVGGIKILWKEIFVKQQCKCSYFSSNLPRTRLGTSQFFPTQSLANNLSHLL